MNIIVVGAGAIGKERIKALETIGGHKIIVVDSLQSEISLPEALTMNPDWVFVCTPHDQTTKIVKQALKHSCKILAEKPLGRNIIEYSLINLHEHPGRLINVGFNYRFYKGVRQLLNDVHDGLFGKLVSVNMVLSLSNAPGSDYTWRMDPERAGRGSILYAGIHLVDIAMLISNNTVFPLHFSQWKGFWKTGIEEEAHIIARDKAGAIYNIQSSVVHWRSTFRVEVNGTDGYGIVEGRNKYYGSQTYIRGKRWGWQSGKSQRDSEEMVISDYDGEDSFFEETKAVLYGCDGIQPATNVDNFRCLAFIAEL